MVILQYALPQTSEAFFSNNNTCLQKDCVQIFERSKPYKLR